MDELGRASVTPVVCDCCRERPIEARGVLWVGPTGEQVPLALCMRCMAVYQRLLAETEGAPS